MIPCSLVIVAAGKGQRMGGIPKQLELIGNRPMWQWSVRKAESLHAKGIVGECILVVSPGEEEHFSKNCSRMPFRVIPGGEKRANSVLNGVSACSCDVVLVHDAARPFASEDLFVAVADATSATNGAIPVCHVTDALKRRDGNSVRPVDRDSLVAAQTPQGFGRALLAESLEAYGLHGNDEAEAWVARGHPLSLIAGERNNFKITYPEDLVLARKITDVTECRTGIGFDVHPLQPGRRLILGGVHIPSPLGLFGHSDADVVAHAVSDAILGAAGEPDIGMLFPASDASYKDADSMDLLHRVVSIVRAKGWSIRWIDVVLSAQYPRLSPYLEEILTRLERTLSSTEHEKTVNLKVKSGEGIGPVGDGQCMECSAVATIERFSERNVSPFTT